MIYVVRYLLIALYTVFWGTVGILVGLVDRSGEGILWVGRRWIDWVLATCGIEIRAEGLGDLDARDPYVLMSNHQSVFDVAAIIASWPGSFRFVAKRELTWVPFFGWALALGGHVIIDRSRRERAVKSLEAAARQVRDGTTVIIFPEGTRSPSGGMGEFKSGGFHLALQAGVPILPVSVSGSRRITPKRSLRIESGPILIRYGRPIPTAGRGIDERQALKDQVRAAIQAGFDADLQRETDPVRAA
ncbi:MAG: lysophospholipid acyltransferase family protein [Myxococcota bacterium]